MMTWIGGSVRHAEVVPNAGGEGMLIKTVRATVGR